MVYIVSYIFGGGWGEECDFVNPPREIWGHAYPGTYMM